MACRSLNDRRILLTGASSGIGHALAKSLAPLRSHLMLVARRQVLLEQLSDELQQLGAASVELCIGDVTDGGLRTSVIDQMWGDWGGLDLLVNNAGVSAHGRFIANGPETLQQIVEVNFLAAAELTRLAVPLLRKGNDPLIVNIGSILGHRGIPYNSEYCASKFALRGWSEAIRPELLREGIELLLVSPGPIDTEFFEHLISRDEDTPWSKQPGISTEQVARQIVRAIQWRRHEIYPNWRSRVLLWLNRFAPGLVDRVMNRYG